MDEECVRVVVQKMTEGLGGSQHRYFRVGKQEMYLLIHTVDSALYIFNLRVQARKMLEKMNEGLPRGRSVSAAVVAPLDAAGLADGYHKASELLGRAFFEGPKSCLDEEEIRVAGAKGSVETGTEELARLHGQCVERFHLFDAKELDGWLDAVRKEMLPCTKDEVHSYIKVNTAELLHKYGGDGQGGGWEALYQAAYFEEMFSIWRECLLKLKEDVDGISGYSKDVQKILQYVGAHYAERVSVEQIADGMEMSAGHISRMFKAETGISLKKYINKVRIDQAMYLLQNTNMKVYEVAERVGIPDYLYFTQVFKNVTSKTPLEVRKETMTGEKNG